MAENFAQQEAVMAESVRFVKHVIQTENIPLRSKNPKNTNSINEIVS